MYDLRVLWKHRFVIDLLGNIILSVTVKTLNYETVGRLISNSEITKDDSRVAFRIIEGHVIVLH